jgi:hypothetical protein
MANTAGVCNSFKSEVLKGIHALGTAVVRAGTSADSLKAALYLASASISASTAAYTATGECAVAGGYSAGGIAVTNATEPSTSGTTGIWTPSASLVFTNITPGGAVDCVLIYNSTQSNKAIEACTFTAQTPAAATLTLTMPTNDASNALLRIA